MLKALWRWQLLRQEHGGSSEKNWSDFERPRGRVCSEPEARRPGLLQGARRTPASELTHPGLLGPSAKPPLPTGLGDKALWGSSLIAGTWLWAMKTQILSPLLHLHI